MNEVFLNKEFYELLYIQNPDLIVSIRQLLNAGQTPNQIHGFVKEKCPANSVVPGLVFGAAKHMLSS